MISSVLQEMASIVVSILLALMVDRWREAVQARKRAHILARGLREELHANRQRVRQSLSRHREILNQTRQALAHPADTLPHFNLVLPALSRAVWNVAIATQILGLFPLSLVIQLSSVYYAQDFLQGWQEHLSRLIFQPTFVQTQEVEFPLKMLAGILENLIQLEERQIQTYREALQSLEAFLNEG